MINPAQNFLKFCQQFKKPNNYVVLILAPHPKITSVRCLRTAMQFEHFRSFVIRHRVSIQDAGIMLAALAVTAYLVFEADVFLHEGQLTPKQKAFELDEVMLLGGLLAIGMLIFSLRRYVEQKRETQRRIEAEKHVRELAFQDALTGLANRRQFDDALRAAISAPPKAGAAHALFLLDLNGFKHINDVYGHTVGDEVLVAVSQRLRSLVRESELVARFGGDEFAILATHLAGPEAASNISLRVIQALEEPIRLGDVDHKIGAGIGMALLPQDAHTVQEALRKADVALYRAKAERRSAMRFFEEDMDRLVREREHMERELRAAVATDSITMFFQPTVDLTTKEILGFEGIPRWNHANLGEIPLERFIPIAEEIGLIHELSEKLLRQACAAAKCWPESIVVSIDAFSGQLTDPNMSSRILAILNETGLKPNRLEIEITESLLVRNLEAAQEIFGSLRENGVRIALDNFGTGYSSLYHLRNFKLDKVKIDRSFIDSISSSPEDRGVVRALVGLGQGLGLTISAEGIGSNEQSKTLLGSGCNQGQGDLFSEAISASETMNLFLKIA
jgi:diguanylate cyclase (GGDEF)-like protein